MASEIPEFDTASALAFAQERFSYWREHPERWSLGCWEIETKGGESILWVLVPEVRYASGGVYSWRWDGSVL